MRVEAEMSITCKRSISLRNSQDNKKGEQG